MILFVEDGDSSDLACSRLSVWTSENEREKKKRGRTKAMSTLNFLWQGPVVKKKPPFFNARADLAWNYAQHCQRKASSVFQIKGTISWNYVVVEVFITKSVTTYVWLYNQWQTKLSW